MRNDTAAQVGRVAPRAPHIATEALGWPHGAHGMARPTNTVLSVHL